MNAICIRIQPKIWIRIRNSVLKTLFPYLFLSKWFHHHWTAKLTIYVLTYIYTYTCTHTRAIELHKKYSTPLKPTIVIFFQKGWIIYGQILSDDAEFLSSYIFRVVGSFLWRCWFLEKCASLGRVVIQFWQKSLETFSQSHPLIFQQYTFLLDRYESIRLS